MFVIFFRNDYFSMLYCYFEIKELVLFVIDVGYCMYVKVVWESLVDVNGEWM